MTRERAELVRVVLLTRRDTPAFRDPIGAKIRRYRLARVAIARSGQSDPPAARRERGGKLARNARLSGA
jgi:hypothetical protein